MNIDNWNILLGIGKHTPVKENSSNVKTHLIEDDDDDITTKNIYLYSQSFVDDIKNLIADVTLKPEQIYDILLKQNKIPVTRYGRIMKVKTFRDYVLDIRQEVGQEPRPYTKCASIRRLYDSGLDDPVEISQKLNIEIGYVRAVLKKYLNRQTKNRNAEIRSKANEMVVLYLRDKKSTVKIAKLLNISSSAVRRNLAKMGVKFRSKKDYFNSKKVA